MNLALSTLVLFFFLIPGLVFRRFYYSEEFSREYFRESFFGVFIATILPSLFFHSIWYFLAQVFRYKVDLIILSNLGSQEPQASFQNIQDHALLIIIYNLSLFITSAFAGYYLKKVVRDRKWDRKYKFFRFQNQWHYQLNGEFFDFPRANFTLKKDSVEDIELVFIDAIVEINNEAFLYDGILVDYELSNTGGLATITIKNSKRRKLVDDNGDDSSNESKYYSVVGHVLVLKYSEIKNINFTYVVLEKDESDKKLTTRLVE